jgi:hypothetical protein
MTITDVMPDVAPTTAICPAMSHNTDRAYRVYRCRCPEATIAHGKWRAVGKTRTDPACRVRHHRTSGGRRNGCTCPDPVPDWRCVGGHTVTAELTFIVPGRGRRCRLCVQSWNAKLRRVR